MKSTVVLALAGSLLLAAKAGAAQFRAVETGGWNTPSTWSATGTAIPGAADDVEIPAGIRVAVDCPVTIGPGRSLVNRGALLNSSRICNRGTITNAGTFINFRGCRILNSGTIDNIIEYPIPVGTIENGGLIEGVPAGGPSPAINNYGQIDNFTAPAEGPASRGTIRGGTLNNISGSSTGHGGGAVGAVTNPAGSLIENCAINNLGGQFYNCAGGALLTGAGGTIDDSGTPGSPGPVFAIDGGEVFNAGSIAVSGMTIALNSNLNNQGSLSVPGKSGGPAGNTIANSGSIENPGVITIANAIGRIANTGTIMNRGVIHGHSPSQVTGSPAPRGIIYPVGPVFP
jgi:hypothetical protein